MEADEYIDYQRFAEDVFSLLWLQFKVPRVFNPIPRLQPNTYSSNDILRSVVRSVNMSQIVSRNMLYDIFESAILLSKVDLDLEENLFNFTSQVIHFMWLNPAHVQGLHIFAKTAQALSVSAELVLYLVSKDIKIDLKRIPPLWTDFFTCELSLVFVAEGGFKRFFEECDRVSYLDVYLKPFISNHCIPYVGEDVFKKYRDFVASSGHQNSEPEIFEHLHVFPKKVENKVGNPVYALKPRPRLDIIPRELRLTRDMYDSPPKSEPESSPKKSPNRLSPQERKAQKGEKQNKLRLLNHQKAQTSPKKGDKRSESLKDKGLDLNSSADPSVYDISTNCQQNSRILSPEKVSFKLPDDHTSYERSPQLDYSAQGARSKGKSPVSRCIFPDTRYHERDKNFKNKNSRVSIKGRFLTEEHSQVTRKVKSVTEDNLISRKVISATEDSPVSRKVKSASEDSSLSRKIKSPTEEDSTVSRKVKSITEEGGPILRKAKSIIELSKLVSLSAWCHETSISNQPTKEYRPVLRKVKSIADEGGTISSKAKSIVEQSKLVSSLTWCYETSISNLPTEYDRPVSREVKLNSKEDCQMSNKKNLQTEEYSRMQSQLKSSTKEDSQDNKEEPTTEDIPRPKEKLLSKEDTPKKGTSPNKDSPGPKEQQSPVKEDILVLKKIKSLCKADSPSLKTGKSWTKDDFSDPKKEQSLAGEHSLGVIKGTSPFEDHSQRPKVRSSSAEASPKIKKGQLSTAEASPKFKKRYSIAASPKSKRRHSPEVETNAASKTKQSPIAGVGTKFKKEQSPSAEASAVSKKRQSPATQSSPISMKDQSPTVGASPKFKKRYSSTPSPKSMKGQTPSAEASPKSKKRQSPATQSSQAVSKQGQSPTAKASPKFKKIYSSTPSPKSKKGLSPAAKARPKSKRHSFTSSVVSKKGQSPAAEALPKFMEQPPSKYMICYERFAEDIFSFLWFQFKVPRHMVPLPQCPPNTYRSSRIVTALVRAVNLNQIVSRKMLHNIFETASHVTENFLETSEDMHTFLTEVIFYVFDHVEKSRTYDIFTKVIHSLTIPVELVLYLISKKVGSYYIANMPLYWNVFFTMQLSREFFTSGGFETLQEKCELAAFVDAYLKDFISKYCMSYTGEDLYQKYCTLYYQTTNPNQSPTQGNSPVLKEVDSPTQKEID